ncbi:hypothetical protein ZHAS_00017486 [Anopheles sinensis]|uniref:Uncharacterized protein n=1 Tax=Anopheles sinensis TaxID=74873 RepID=A0A084WGP3_ANOSI|nr:hypothetical protein ZHAS_00017486 [Anopheles sinensis]
MIFFPARHDEAHGVETAEQEKEGENGDGRSRTPGGREAMDSSTKTKAKLTRAKTFDHDRRALRAGR